MAQLDLIYISSSDDDSEVEEIENPNYRNSSGKSAGRRNTGGWVSDESSLVRGSAYKPLILMVHVIFCAGYGGVIVLDSSSKQENTSIASSSSAYNHSLVEQHAEPGSSNYVLNHRIARGDESLNLSKSGNTSHLQTVNSRIANISGADYEKIPSQQAWKRTLTSSLQPSSFQSFAPGSRLNNLKDNMRSQIYDAYCIWASPLCCRK